MKYKSIKENTLPNIKFKHSTLSKEGIEIIELSELHARRSQMNHNPNKPHRVHFYLMIYIEAGEGVHRVDLEQYFFKKGDFIFIHKNQIQAFDLSSELKGKAVLFTEKYIEKIQTNINLSGSLFTDILIFRSPLFSPSSILTTSSRLLFSEIDKEIKYKDKNSLIVMLLFSSLFLMIERERPNAYINKLTLTQVKQFNDFRTLLNSKIVEERDALYYAKKLNISYKTLNNLCKLSTNETLKQFIDAYLIIELKRHLILEDKQIQEIAYDFGFMELSNFSKYFKKHTSFTPLQFKKQVKS